jgi:hypothetical protein
MTALLQRTLFDSAGRRRLPAKRALDDALARLSPEALFWFCEKRPGGPLYLLPSRELIRALTLWLRALAGARGRVLEVGAGDGFLSDALRAVDPKLRITATDSGAWEQPGARMTAAEQRRHGKQVHGLALGKSVERLDALAAVRKYRPDVVLAAWLPPGPLLAKLVRSSCKYVVEIGAAGGVTAHGEWDWRFAHDFAPPNVETAARSRLDAAGERHTHVTLYFGRRHPEFREERPKRGDWLWQFKP